MRNPLTNIPNEAYKEFMNNGGSVVYKKIADVVLKRKYKYKIKVSNKPKS